MKMLIVFASAALAVAGYADQTAEKDAKAAPKAKLTKAERIARGGGICEKPGSQTGKVAFIDTQDLLSADDIKGVIATATEEWRYNLVYEKAAPAECCCTLKDASKADLAIVIVNDPKKPTSLVAVDDGWAMVNVAKLDVGLNSESAKQKFFAGRCRREILKIYAILAGGWGSQYPGNIGAPQKLQDLDHVREFIPADVVDRIEAFMKFRGIRPTRATLYRRACREGWAPAPTNDVQKAIWEDVHKLPTKPIVIQPEKAK